jgi:hypothetical protein
MHQQPGVSESWNGSSDHGARRTIARIALLLLAAAAVYQGLWAQIAPRSFYRDFPGGMSWIAREGVYNEHLVRDIGGLVNGLAVLAVVAAWTLARPVLVATAVGWLVYSIPHFTFHVSHPLGDSSMQGFNLVVLTSQIVLPLLGLLAISTRREPAADTGHLAVGMHDTVDVSAQPGVETGDDLSLRPGGSHP